MAKRDGAIKIGDKVKVINPISKEMIVVGYAEKIEKGKVTKVRYPHPAGDKWEILNTEDLIVKLVLSLLQVIIVKYLPRLIKRLKKNDSTTR